MIPANTTLTKGHGAGNDFIMVPDPEGALEISAADVAALCNRHTGIGADGLIRVVRSAASGAMEARGDAPEWFMDYRNADGSIAEMCGNGVRVFAHYLATHGLASLGLGEHLTVATRGGDKTVTRESESIYTVDMGEYGLPFGAGGADTRVTVPGLGPRPALSVTMPNPHTVVILDSLAELDAAQLDRQPGYDPVPREGTNLELVVRQPDRAQMRVLERGVGETLACGTGTCAVAVALLLAAGTTEGTVPIHSPGGDLSVRIEAGHAHLTGPAQLVAEIALR
ncbi:MAG: diaminopimelate epimerase [Ancrocorticia sp.]|uniref:diaminopimelate epimerase n=1 Tax=Ancrocorticia sp. TaxID=2593684 RepID=UPI003F8FC0E6